MSEIKVPAGYKQTEVGIIPEDWDVKTLGNITTLQRGFDLPSRLRKVGQVPIISSAGVSGFHNKAMAKANGVVTGRYGTIGETFFVEEDFWPLNTTLYVSDFKDNDPLFIYFLLKTIDFQSHSGKSGVPGVNRNDLHELIITSPPTKEEQTAIATVLSDVDALIASLNGNCSRSSPLQYLRRGNRQTHRHRLFSQCLLTRLADNSVSADT
ncbi:restriction endonuclease subunit S [Thiothrix litoralis]|uniref:Restriction endonuclease subunit S n=1 Tax=Thiothrix litoralis TaxID=2891210 RepID=A0ABX7WUU1_9GAMM|nr:restriction endonuclease subunit S [Thiothrix litoralis]QTR47332.1 restriction endonuclease subunit S [Thiothrix litoralis]